MSSRPLSATVCTPVGAHVAIATLFGLGLLAAPPARAGFEITGDLAMVRSNHTATLLADGRVLLAGGVEPSVGRPISASAELYDPASGTFSATADMHAARVDHAATLLPDGRVLVVGGYGDGETQANGELYDPLLETFTPVTSAFAVGGERTAAITLADGRALVVGGFNMGARSEAWLFDPATDSFSATGSMASGRYVHTLTLLGDGRVLVVGGVEPQGGPRDDAELYDPATGLFTPVASTMSVARERHASTLLPDGRVLVAGGYTWKGEQLETAELFDPLTGTFAATGDMSMPRIEFRLVGLEDGQVLAIGSYQWELPAATAELYDPVAGAFSPITPGPSTEREATSATRLLDGRVLVAGGHDLMDPKGGWVAYGELYEHATGADDTIFADGFEAPAR